MNAPGIRLGHETVAAKIYRYKVNHPTLTRGGIVLQGWQIHDEILRMGGVATLRTEDQEFLEGVADERRAHAEVRKHWAGSHKQAQWLSDIHRQLSPKERA